MPQYGPYEIGSTIPEEALFGVNRLTWAMHVVVGDFPRGTITVAGETVRQDINASCIVTSDTYVGPPIATEVQPWSTRND